MKPTYLNNFDEYGYGILPIPNYKEMEWLYDFIEKIWLQVISENYPKLLKNAKNFGLQYYHKLSPEVDHSNLWSKHNRLFTDDQVMTLRNNLSIFNHLKILFNKYIIVDTEGLGYPEIYWRIVRPNFSEDVGPAHKDSWFFSLTNNMSKNEQNGIIKIWLPVVCEKSISGLAVSPGSHKIEIPFESELRHGRLKPINNLQLLDNFPMKILALEPGQAVFFDKDLLHKGLSHSGMLTRVSIEFAIKTN